MRGAQVKLWEKNSFPEPALGCRGSGAAPQRGRIGGSEGTKCFLLLFPFSKGSLAGLVTHPCRPRGESSPLRWVKDKERIFPLLQDCLFLLFSFAEVPFRASRVLYFQLEILAANLARATSIPVFMYQPVCWHTLARPCPLRKIFSLQKEKRQEQKKKV